MNQDETDRLPDGKPHEPIERDESGAINGNDDAYQTAGTTGDVDQDETGVKADAKQP